MDEYKAVSYGLWQAVKDVETKYRDRVESQMEQHNTRRLWQGLQTYHRLQGQIPLNCEC